jgi:hypothetical protein
VTGHSCDVKYLRIAANIARMHRIVCQQHIWLADIVQEVADKSTYGVYILSAKLRVLQEWSNSKKLPKGYSLPNFCHFSTVESDSGPNRCMPSSSSLSGKVVQRVPDLHTETRVFTSSPNVSSNLGASATTAHTQSDLNLNF